jgi:hypothetical protein
VHRISAAVAAIVVTTAVAAGAGQAAAGTAEAGTAAGWVVENPRPDGVFDIGDGSASLRFAGGTIECPVVAGWGRADSGTLRPNDFFGETGVTSYADCTGPGTAGLTVDSSPGTVFVPEAYDAGADRISGSAYPWTWGLFLTAPECQVDLYPQDSNAPAPLTYDNATATLATGPVDLVVTRAEGTGCADLPEVGDEVTYETTVVATPGFTVRPA